MAEEIINIGTNPNDGTGDRLRVAFVKVEHNFEELYATDRNTANSIGILSNNTNQLANAVNNVSSELESAYGVANAAFDRANTGGIDFIRRIDQYSVGIKPSSQYFDNELTIYPTADYDIHLFESAFGGAVTLGNYGNTTFKVYGRGEVNGENVGSIKASLDYGSYFSIETEGDNGIHRWKFDANGVTQIPGEITHATNNFSIQGNVLPSQANTYSLGSPELQWKSLYVSGNTIFMDNTPLSMGSNGTFTSHGNIKINNTNGRLLDVLDSPLINPDALDINLDGGTSIAVFSVTDNHFDGGAVSTIFGIYEAGVDGGASFNNKHSASYIDGGGSCHI